LNIQEIFPYKKYRKGQEKAILFIKETLANRKIGLLYAPTGIGKTIAALTGYVASKKEDSKLVVLTRTKNQAEIFVREIRYLNKKSLRDTPLKFVVFRSKMDMCLLRKIKANIKKMPYKQFLVYCELLKKRKKCPFYSNCYESGEPTQIFLAGIEKALNLGGTFRNVMKIGKESRICPYELARALGEKVDIVIGSYNYIFSPEIRESFLSAISRDISHIKLIVDEAHNLPEFISDAYSLELPIRSIELAKKEIEKFEFDEVPDVLDFLNSFIEILETKSKVGKMVNDSLILVDTTIIRNILDERILISMDHLARKIMTEEEIIPRIAWISEFLKKFIELSKRPDYITLLKKENKEEIITLLLLDPSDIGNELFSEIGGAVLMSGSLYPIEYYEMMLGLKRENIKDRLSYLVLQPPFPEDAQMILADVISTTKYTERSEEMYNLLASRVETIVLNSPPRKSILVVFPSYDLMWRITDKLYLERPFILEDRYTDIKSIIRKFEENPSTVVFSVASGKLAEGIDYRLSGKTLLSMVVIVGFPFPEINEILEIRRKYFEKKFDKRTASFITIIAPAIRRVLQAGGRLLRAEDDRGVIIILDKRFWQNSYWRFFPPSWQNYTLFRTNSELEDILKRFFKFKDLYH